MDELEMYISFNEIGSDMLSCMVVLEIILQPNQKKGGGRMATGEDALFIGSEKDVVAENRDMDWCFIAP